MFALRNSTTQSLYALSLSADKAVRRKERVAFYITFPTAHKYTHARAFAFITFSPPVIPLNLPPWSFYVSSCFNRRKSNGRDGHRSSRSLYKRVEKRVALVVSHVTLKEAFCFAFFFHLAPYAKESVERQSERKIAKVNWEFFHVLQLLPHYFCTDSRLFLCRR